MREFAVDFIEEQHLEAKLNERRSAGWLLHTLAATQHVAMSDAHRNGVIFTDDRGYRRQRFTAVWVKFTKTDGYPVGVPLGYNLI